MVQQNQASWCSEMYWFSPLRHGEMWGMNGKNQKVVSHYLDVPGS